MSGSYSGGLGGIWTPDLLSASQAFIPAELPAHGLALPESDTIPWYLGFAREKIFVNRKWLGLKIIYQNVCNISLEGLQWK